MSAICTAWSLLGAPSRSWERVHWFSHWRFWSWARQHNVGERSQNHCSYTKEISITYSECVIVALVIQRAINMRRIILSSVACLAVPYFFPRYLINGAIFWTRYCTWNMCFDSLLQVLSGTFLIFFYYLPECTNLSEDSATVLTCNVSGMQQIHPVIYRLLECNQKWLFMTTGVFTDH